MGKQILCCRLIAMTLPNEKNGMRVKPLLVSQEAAQRSGGSDVDSVQMILSATTERNGASGGATEEVASWYAESGRLQA
jgi:hypothetical protein